MFHAMFLILFRPVFFCSYILFRTALFLFLHFAPHCYIFVPPIFVPIGDSVDSETSLLCFASLLCLPLLCFVSLSLFRIEFCSKLTLNQSRAEFILDILRATPSAAGPTLRKRAVVVVIFLMFLEFPKIGKRTIKCGPSGPVFVTKKIKKYKIWAILKICDLSYLSPEEGCWWWWPPNFFK